MYICELCNYETIIKGNFEKHLNAKKHLMFKALNTKAANREKRKVRKLTSDNQNNIDQIVEEKENQIQLLISQINELETNVRLASNCIQSPFNNVRNNHLGLVQTYSLAIELKPIDDYSLLQPHTHDDFMYRMVSDYGENQFVTNIGKFIVDKYQNNDPRFQSIFNCDMARHHYKILRKNNHKIFQFSWDDDRGGVLTRQIIIDPLLEYIKVCVTKYYNPVRYEKIVRDRTNTKDRDREMELQNFSVHLIESINDGTLSIQILHYLSSLLCLTSQQKQLILNHSYTHPLNIPK